MDLSNKALVSDLLNALRNIKSAKENIDCASSIHYSSVDKSLLGGYIASIVDFYPSFIEDFKDFLDKEVEDIDTKLKNL